MHWIESLFGVSPDAGSGLTELLFLLALVLVAVMLVGTWIVWRRRA